MEKRKTVRRLEATQSVDEETKISILISSIYYFLDFVFIITEGGCFRLVVIHNKKLLTNRVFKSVKAARAAFTRLYDEKAWKEDIKPNWSVFYRPDAKWLNERREVMNKGIR